MEQSNGGFEAWLEEQQLQQSYWRFSNAFDGVYICIYIYVDVSGIIFWLLVIRFNSLSPCLLSMAITTRVDGHVNYLETLLVTNASTIYQIQSLSLLLMPYEIQLINCYNILNFNASDFLVELLFIRNLLYDCWWYLKNTLN